MVAAKYTAVFVDHLRDASGDRSCAADALDGLLGKLVAEGEASLPAASIPAEAFVAFLAERVPAGEPPQAFLRELPVADLYLACGCLHGDPQAASAFREKFLPLVAAVTRGLTPETAVEDIFQDLYEKLFLRRQDREPKIAHYQGRGNLATWLKVVVMRMGIDLHRHAPIEQGLQESMVALLSCQGNQESKYLQKFYRSHLKEAVSEAFAVLTSKQRNVLRFRLIDGLPMYQIAKVYQVHAVTLSRWFAEIRGKILDAVRRRMKDSLSARDLGRIIDQVEGDVSLSLERLLDPEFDSQDPSR